MENLGCHAEEFHEIVYFIIFRKYVEKIQFFKNLTRVKDTLRQDQ